MDPLELERLIDRELRQLPSPRAPETLVPRVMRAVRTSAVAAARPGFGWRAWPASWQAAAIAAALLIVFGVASLWPVLVSFADALLTNTDSVTATRIAAVVSATRVVWRVLLQPIVVFAFGIVVVMTAACAVFGTALGRVALGGASRI